MTTLSLRSLVGCARTTGGMLLVGVLLLLAPSGFAQGAVGPFTTLSGAWSGDGTIALNNGSRERIRCRANYAVREGGRTLKMELRCASDSYKFELSSDVQYDDGAISGIWSETLRNATGYLSGRARSGQIQVKVDSPAFSADLLVQTRGDRQSVTIRSPGSQISEVVIALQKRG